MKKVFVHFGRMSLVAAALCAGPVFAETLEQAVQHTIQTNPEVLAAEERYEASTQEIRKAQGSFLPNLDLAAGIGREETRNATTRALINRDKRTLTRKEGSLIASQELFSGLSTVNEVKRTEAASRSAAFGVNTTAQDIALSVSETYINVLRYRELVRLAQANLATHRQLYDMIQSRTTAGVSKEADLTQASGRVALAKANVQTQQGNLREAEVTYLKVVGRTPHLLSMPVFPRGVLPQNKEAAIAQALKQHPTLKSAQEDLEAAKAQRLERFATNYPQLNAELGVSRNNGLDGVEGTNNSTYGMLRLNYNLYNGGSDLAEQRRTAFAQQEAAKIRDLTYRQVRESVGLAWTAMEVNRRLMEQYARYKREARKTADAYRDQFKLSQRTLLDVLDAENESFNSKISYTNAKMDYLLAQYRVLNAMGALLEGVNVTFNKEKSAV